MKSIKINSLSGFFLALFVLFVAASCKKDEEEECVAPALQTQIVDTWQGSLSALGMTLPVTLTFTEGGEVQGGNLSQYLAMIDGIGEIDDLILYQVPNDTSVNIIVTEDGETTPFPLSVTERDCERIVMASVVGDVTITLTKQ